MTIPTATKPLARITGVGSTGYPDRFPDSVPIELMTRAFNDALEDAHLTKADIDGLIVHPSSTVTPDIDELTYSWGLELSYANEMWAHGYVMATALGAAVAAIQMEQAERIAIVFGRSNVRYTSVDGETLPSSQRLRLNQLSFMEGLRETGGATGEQIIYGSTGAYSGAAIQTARYLHQYGYDQNALADVAMALRYNASLNPRAAHRERFELSDYLASPWIVEPIRLLDCCRVSDGAACVIVEVADDTSTNGGNGRQVNVVAINGAQLGDGSFGMGAWWRGTELSERSRAKDASILTKSGLGHEDIDALYTYDAFTYLVPVVLEKYGFCKTGDGLRQIKEKGMRVGDSLPINTHGGLHSEGHSMSWGATIEMVRQLRGECGERQVADAETLMWAGPRGNSFVLSNS